MFSISWVRAQPSVVCFLAGTWTTGTFRVGAAIAANNAELFFWVPLLCWRFSERMGFGEREMRLSGSSRRELEVPAKQVSHLGPGYHWSVWTGYVASPRGPFVSASPALGL